MSMVPLPVGNCVPVVRVAASVNLWVRLAGQPVSYAKFRTSKKTGIQTI